MSQKKTNDEFLSEVFSLTKNDYTFLDNYNGANTKIRVRHNICGNVYYVKPNNFRHGTRCPRCSFKIGATKRPNHINNEDFQKRVFKLTGLEYTFLDKYSGANEYIRIRHNKCGFVYFTVPNYFFNNGGRCHLCYGKISNDFEFKEKVSKLVGNEYTFLDRYVNSHLKIRVRHNKCGTVYKVAPNHFINGKRCISCFHNSLRTSNDDFIKAVKAKWDKKFTLLEKYPLNSTVHIKIRCNVCGRIWSKTPISILKYGCKYCSLKEKASKGEKAAQKWLDNNNFIYEYGYLIKELFDEAPLHLDFYIPKLHVAIEYDGEQHFREVKLWGGLKTLMKVQKHDHMKDEYCSKHGINLIRIRYDQDVNTILDREFSKIVDPVQESLF